MFTRVDLEAARHGALEPRRLSALDTAPKSALDTAPKSALASYRQLDGFPISTPEIEIASEALRGASSDIASSVVEISDGAISDVEISDGAHAQLYQLPARVLSTHQVLMTSDDL